MRRQVTRHWANAILVPCVLALLLLGSAWMSRDAIGKDEELTSRDIQQALRTLRNAVERGAESLPFDKPQIMELIKEAGGTEVRIVEDDWLAYVIQVNNEAKKMQVVLYDEGDIQLRHQLTGGTWTPEAMNEWNATQRVGKAYIAKGGSIVLEYTLLGSQGRSRAWFQGAMESFHRASGHFGPFALKKNAKEGD